MNLRTVIVELDARQQSRQESDLRMFGCATARWSRSTQQQFQESTYSATIEQARLLINWHRWRVNYLTTPKAAEAVNADSSEAVKADTEMWTLMLMTL